MKPNFNNKMDNYLKIIKIKEFFFKFKLAN